MKTLDKIKSDIACNRRYNWKSLIEYFIEEKSFDLIDKTINEVCKQYAKEQAIDFAEWMDVSNYKFFGLDENNKIIWTTNTDVSKRFSTKEIYEKFKDKPPFVML